MKPHWLVILVTVPILLHTWAGSCCCGCCCWCCICCWNCVCCCVCCWLFPPPNAVWFTVGRVFGYCTVWLNIEFAPILLPLNCGINAKLFCTAATAEFWCCAIAKLWLKFWKPTKFALIICDCKLGMAFCWPAFPSEFRCHGGFDPPPNDIIENVPYSAFTQKLFDEFVQMICTRGRFALSD